MELPKALLWTDGSCAGGRGSGGWAALIITFPGTDVKRAELSGFEPSTTNNRMEMRAAIEGMQYLDSPHSIHLCSDSAYLLNTLREKWYLTWGKQRPNWDLWELLIKLVNFHEVRYVKVTAHSDDPHNNYVDQLAVEARHAGRKECNVQE